jgi:DNA-binding LytR/AlgR family response regulator
MLKIFVCDDEKDILEQVKGMLEKNFEDIEVSLFQDYHDLLEIIQDKNVKVDLLITDIQMQKSGIDISKMILEERPILPIIFISAYAKYCEDIFQIQPVYFLQKPITEDRLVIAINRAKYIIQKQKKVFSYEYNGKVVNVKSSDICYIESKQRKIIFVERENSESIYMKMNAIEEALPEKFVRVHQSFIVNLDYLKSFSQKGVELITGEKIPVSQKRYRDAKIKIMNLMNDEEKMTF